MDHVRRWGPAVWGLVLAVLLLGPVLAPGGFVLSYDMVWVPDLALRSDFLGTGSALPRAVPSDAVVSVVDELLPGSLLQKLVLLGSLVGVAAGVDRWLLSAGLPARLAAVTVAVWNPFVVERLLLGHWTVLVATALLPWIALLARRAGEQGRLPAALPVLLPLGSLSASAGVMSAVVVVAFGMKRIRASVLALLVVLANGPWLVAGALHAGVATSDPDAAARFALQDEGWLPGPLAALGLGGIWNAEVVPVTRTGPLAVLALVVLVALCAAGFSSWRRHTQRRDQSALVITWVIGWVVASLTWLVPDAFAWLAGQVPGGGLLRDGSRMLALCVPLSAILVGHGVGRVVDRMHELTGERAQAVFIGAMLALVPVATMPDAAWGASGALRAVDYPASYADVAQAVPAGRRVLLLPFTSYRAPVWNHERKVLDPLGRYLDEDFVTSDELVVSGETLGGEDPLGDDVRRALSRPDPTARSEALAALGIGTVVVERDAGGDVPSVAGREAAASSDHTVVVLSDVKASTAPVGWNVAMAGAWSGFVGLLLWAVFLGVRRRARR